MPRVCFEWLAQLYYGPCVEFSGCHSPLVSIGLLVFVWLAFHKERERANRRGCSGKMEGQSPFGGGG